MPRASGQTAAGGSSPRLAYPDSCVDKVPDATPSVLVTWMFKEFTSLGVLTKGHMRLCPKCVTVTAVLALLVHAADFGFSIILLRYMPDFLK